MRTAYRLAIITALLLPFSGYGAVLSGIVVSVSDEDTITILDASHEQHKIRLSGIDAPEKKQAYGQRSKQYEREQPSEDRVTYAEAERGARVALVGLWQDAQPVPPWEYRHGSITRK